MKKIICWCLAVVLFLMGGCSATPDAGAIADYADAQIVVSGLTDEDFTVTVADLAALPTVERSASATRSNGERVSVDAVGPLLDTFLAQYGKQQSDFTSIRFSATDQYAISVDANLLANREIILAVSDNGQALSADDQPLRVVIPDERAMYWVRHLCRIDFASNEAESRCEKIVILTTAVKTLQSQDYQYNGVTDQAIAISDLFDSYVNDSAAATVQLTAADGLNKTETAANFRSGLLKYTGTDAPRFVSDTLPEGMEIHDLTIIACGGTTFLTLDKLIAIYGDAQGLDFFKLATLAGMPSAEQYLIRTADGASITYNVDELSGALVSLDAAGNAVLTPANGQAVVDLLQAEAAP